MAHMQFALPGGHVNHCPSLTQAQGHSSFPVVYNDGGHGQGRIVWQPLASALRIGTHDQNFYITRPEARGAETPMALVQSRWPCT